MSLQPRPEPAHYAMCATCLTAHFLPDVALDPGDTLTILDPAFCPLCRAVTVGTPPRIRTETIAVALRAWRQEEARRCQVPAFWVLTNALVAKLADARPFTLEQLAAVPGMGRARVDRYGAAILALVAGQEVSA